MNRSILIVICDFLLVSLLAFSTVDLNKAVEEGTERLPRLDISTNQPDARQDIAAVMKMALRDERRARDQVVGELSRARDTLTRSQVQLTERERQIQTYQQQLQAEVQQAQRLQQERAILQQQVVSAQTNIQSLQQQWQATTEEARRLQQERQNLQQQYGAVQTNILNLRQQLQARSTEALMSREKLSASEDELRRQQEQALALQRRLGTLESSNQLSQAEKQQFAERLQVAEAERRFAAQQLSRLYDELKSTREEKARLTEHAEKLADNVKSLANNSGELAKEIRESRPLAANTIYEVFLTNRVHARFQAARPGLLGQARREREADLVLVSNGTNTYALCHVEDTAVVLFNPATDWESLGGTLQRKEVTVPLNGMSFCVLDPRVVLIPVSADDARRLGCKVFRMSPEPFKFQEAVVVGLREGYYGECAFQIDLATPQYLKMDRNLVKGFFGKFNPTHGDLVFSRTGDILGIMANSTYCVMVHDFASAAALRFGEKVPAQSSGEILSRLYLQVAQLPFKLQ